MAIGRVNFMLYLHNIVCGRRRRHLYGKILWCFSSGRREAC